MIKESPLMIKSKAFALDVINVCKELRVAKCESEYWIELLLESRYYNDKTLLENCTQVKRILISSINTAKENIK